MTEAHPSSPTPTPGGHLRASLAQWFAPEHRLLWISGLVLLVVLAVWTYFTPSGLLGKADAVGYAVCHRIKVRSFLFPNGRQLPMCARCSGTFLGVLVGLLGPGLLFRRRHALEFPPMLIVGIMLAASAAWAFDGANSFAHLIPSDVIPKLYQPTNFLRLLTGTFHGITLGSLVLPVFNASVWADASPDRTLDSLWQLGLLYAVGAVLMVMVLSGLAIFLYPLALLSAVGAVAVLTVVNSVILAAVLRPRECRPDAGRRTAGHSAGPDRCHSARRRNRRDAFCVLPHVGRLRLSHGVTFSLQPFPKRLAGVWGRSPHVPTA